MATEFARLSERVSPTMGIRMHLSGFSSSSLTLTDISKATSFSDSFSAIDVFLGVLLGISSASYNKGFKTFNVPVEALRGVGSVTFTVNAEDLPPLAEEVKE